MTNPSPNDVARDAAILEIARRETPFQTLTPTRSGADFHEVAVWTIEQALTAAYEAGREAERRERPPLNCECPACGRDIEIRSLT